MIKYKYVLLTLNLNTLSQKYYKHFQINLSSLAC
jgi:hypothetical protein